MATSLTKDIEGWIWLLYLWFWSSLSMFIHR